MHAWNRLASAGLAVVVVLTGTSVALIPPAAAGPAACVAEAPDQASALLTARRCAQRVEVLDRRSETRQVFANASGTLTLEESLEPQRVKRGGTWSPIDTTLVVAADGTLHARSTLTDVAFSGGGTAPLAALDTTGGRVALGWPTALPKPVLERDVATYREVIPGVDLQVRALASGFSHVLVVRTREAAKSPALHSIRYRMQTPGLTGRSSGDGYELVDGAGKVAVRSGPPLMWDSTGADGAGLAAGGVTTQQRSADRAVAERAGLVSSGRQPGERARQSTARLRFVADELIVQPDPAMLDDPAATLPIYVDPPFETWWHHWTYADSTNVNRDRAVMRVGHNTDGSGDFRSFFEFPTAALAGKRVIDARMYVTLVHSWACASTPVSLYFTTAVPMVDRVAWSPGLTQHLDERWGNAHKGAEACGNQPDMAMEFGGGLAGLLQSAANNGWGAITLGLSTRRSNGTAESTESYWKKFNTSNLRLTADYNSYPNTPDGLSTDNRACSGRPFVGMPAPTLRARVTDPDGTGSGQLTGAFEWQRWNAAGQTWAAAGSAQQTNVPHDSTAQVTAGPALADGGIYRWHARTGDGLGDWSNWSDWCEFGVDLTGPTVAPVVSSPLYKDDLKNFYGQVGWAADFTFAANGVADVAGYRYGWVTPAITEVAAPAPGGSVTLRLAPPPPDPGNPSQGGISTLYVQSFDLTGRPSPERRYVFLVGSVDQDPRAVWLLNEPAGATVLAETGGYEPPQPATVSGATTRIPGPSAGTAVSFDGAAHAATADAAVDGRNSFTVSVWAKRTGDGLDSAFPTVFDQGGFGYHRNALGLYYNDGSGHWVFGVGLAGGANGDAPPVGVWSHLVGVYDAAAHTVRLWIDGVEQTAGAEVEPPDGDVTGPFVIGACNPDSGITDRFVGGIAGLRLWNRALSPTEVTTLTS